MLRGQVRVAGAGTWLHHMTHHSTGSTRTGHAHLRVVAIHPALLEQLDAACQEVGRNRDEIEITAMWFGPNEGEEALTRYEELGVSRLVAMIPALGRNPLEALDGLGEFIAKR